MDVGRPAKALSVSSNGLFCRKRKKAMKMCDVMNHMIPWLNERPFLRLTVLRYVSQQNGRKLSDKTGVRKFAKKLNHGYRNMYFPTIVDADKFQQTKN